MLDDPGKELLNKWCPHLVNKYGGLTCCDSKMVSSARHTKSLLLSRIKLPNPMPSANVQERACHQLGSINRAELRKVNDLKSVKSR